MSDSPLPPAARPKMSPVLRIVVIVCGLIAIVGGIMQMNKGLAGTKMDPEVERLSKESDE